MWLNKILISIGITAIEIAVIFFCWWILEMNGITLQTGRVVAAIDAEVDIEFIGLDENLSYVLLERNIAWGYVFCFMIGMPLFLTNMIFITIYQSRKDITKLLLNKENKIHDDFKIRPRLRPRTTRFR